MQFREILLIVCIVASSLLVTACVERAQQQSGQLVVATTFYPLQEIVRNVGKEEVDAYTVIPAGVEPHEYEPTPQDIVKFHDATAFVTMGLAFSPIEQKLIDSGAPAVVIRATQGVALLREHTDEFGTITDLPVENDSSQTGVDPHIWLSPRNMILMTRQVEQGLAALDPRHAAYYKANADTYVASLEQLDSEFTTGLATCHKHTILTTHRAFSYLVRDYGITQLSIGGINPEAEPTPRQLQSLIDATRTNNITVIFYEELVDPRIAQTIATDVGASISQLSPIEGSKNPGDTYLGLMRMNLEHLKSALECY